MPENLTLPAGTDDGHDGPASPSGGHADEAGSTGTAAIAAPQPSAPAAAALAGPVAAVATGAGESDTPTRQGSRGGRIMASFTKRFSNKRQLADDPDD